MYFLTYTYFKMFEEVDKLIHDCKEEQEMKDFLEKNIYPERLKSKYIYKDIPPIRNSPLSYIVNEDSTFNYSYIINKLNEVDNLIHSLKNQINNCSKTCPICICEINNTNIIIPHCGHKTCIGCFVSNLAQNKHTGNLCSVCRATIIP